MPSCCTINPAFQCTFANTDLYSSNLMGTRQKGLYKARIPSLYTMPKEKSMTLIRRKPYQMHVHLIYICMYNINNEYRAPRMSQGHLSQFCYSSVNQFSHKYCLKTRVVNLRPVSQKILSPPVILSMEKTMVAMVINELKSISKLKDFSRN